MSWTIQTHYGRILQTLIMVEIPQILIMATARQLFGSSSLCVAMAKGSPQWFEETLKASEKPGGKRGILETSGFLI